MDYVPRDLRTILNSASAKRLALSEEQVVLLAFNMLSAVDLVHSLGLMHRDIKPANFLVETDYGIKLCDFGSARPVISEN